MECCCIEPVWGSDAAAVKRVLLRVRADLRDSPRVFSAEEAGEG